MLSLSFETVVVTFAISNKNGILHLYRHNLPLVDIRESEMSFKIITYDTDER